MLLTRRHALCGLATAAALNGFPAGGAEAAPFVVNSYGGRWESFWRTQLMPKLQPALGRELKLDIGVGTAWIAAFRAAGKQTPPYSVLMTNERYAVILRGEGFFDKLPAEKIPNLSDVLPSARYADDAAVTGMFSPIGIAYRRDLVKTPPKSWRELWNPAYAGQIGLYSIDNSAAIMLLMLAGQLFGSGADDIDAAVKKFAELKPFPQVALSGQLAPLLTQGQIALAPLDFGEVIALKRRGVPVEIAVPEEGLLMFDQSFNLLAHGADKEVGCRYIDFILSPETQLMLVREFFVAPVNRKVQIPADLAAQMPLTEAALSNVIRIDWALAAKLREAMVERWSKAI
jgi:putative spermidine/putrescine transport system substrate-binding protein